MPAWKRPPASELSDDNVKRTKTLPDEKGSSDSVAASAPVPAPVGFSLGSLFGNSDREERSVDPYGRRSSNSRNAPVVSYPSPSGSVATQQTGSKVSSGSNSPLTTAGGEPAEPLPANRPQLVLDPRRRGRGNDSPASFVASPSSTMSPSGQADNGGRAQPTPVQNNTLVRAPVARMGVAPLPAPPTAAVTAPEPTDPLLTLLTSFSASVTSMAETSVERAIARKSYEQKAAAYAWAEKKHEGQSSVPEPELVAKAEAEKKFNELNNQLTKKKASHETLVQALATAVAASTKPNNSAELEMEVAALGSKVHEQEQELKRLADQGSHLMQVVDQARPMMESISHLESQQNGLKKELDSVVKSFKLRFDSEKTAMDKKFNAHSETALAQAKSIQGLERSNDRRKDNIEVLERDVKDLSKEVKNLDQDVDTLSGKARKLGDRVEAMEKRSSDIGKEFQACSNAVQSLKGSSAAAKIERTSLKDKFNNLESDVKKVVSDIQDIRKNTKQPQGVQVDEGVAQRISNLETSISEFRESRVAADEAARRISQLEAAISELNARVAALDSAKHSANDTPSNQQFDPSQHTADVQELKDELRNIRTDIGGIRQDFTVLQAEQEEKDGLVSAQFESLETSLQDHQQTLTESRQAFEDTLSTLDSRVTIMAQTLQDAQGNLQDSFSKLEATMAGLQQRPAQPMSPGFQQVDGRLLHQYPPPVPAQQVLASQSPQMNSHHTSPSPSPVPAALQKNVLSLIQKHNELDQRFVKQEGAVNLHAQHIRANIHAIQTLEDRYNNLTTDELAEADRLNNLVNQLAVQQHKDRSNVSSLSMTLQQNMQMVEKAIDAVQEQAKTSLARADEVKRAVGQLEMVVQKLSEKPDAETVSKHDYDTNLTVINKQLEHLKNSTTDELDIIDRKLSELGGQSKDLVGDYKSRLESVEGRTKELFDYHSQQVERVGKLDGLLRHTASEVGIHLPLLDD
ncbi:hypothetical protein H2199_005134 [Coniosporium tulheliwenetii]|uniref:Uncharacterized protein n=1 Tax=Coniosporium tulheliwenetii TaxID=3383036 RepID=A0ACC2Z2L0_9PEZI|nr:hypothetical protein H2199_005134 [Cladosporium sp. JES 115]